MQKLYRQAKTIHVWVTPAVVLISILMMITGFVMKYPDFYFANARQLHGTVSVIASVLWGIMIVTGIIMYSVPLLLKLQSRKKTE